MSDAKKQIVENIFFRRKLSWRESSETRFGKVSRRKLRENVEKLREHVGVGGMAEPLKYKQTAHFKNYQANELLVLIELTIQKNS